ncbi:hypothetical protein INT45_013156 [Circinella minor]|uniref:Uncharacterized protein n=1 Tax=Circinella minor TaxID=1195481 RepID=A0A8H7RYA4_9FUNG|nr:hypothetical protein INT45_013156 [Circinella minor]
MTNLLQEFKGISISTALTEGHIVFTYFEKIYEQPTISCNDITDLLSQHFKDSIITSCAVNEQYTLKKCHLTYKRVVHQLAARDDDTTLLQ